MKTLKLGSRGPQVELLQLGLTRAGFPPAGGIDGNFGSGTYNALRSFQTRNSLFADGIAGQQTWTRLTPWLTGYTTRSAMTGDTFYGLAARYNTTIRAIETANPNINPFNIRPGSTIVIPFAFPIVPTNISFTSTVMDFVIRGLRARYPFLRIGNIGSSVLGKPLNYIDIGSGDNQVFFNGSHHSDEWITTTLLMKFLENYAQAYSIRGTIFNLNAVELYNGARLSIVPMVNPDGAGFNLNKNRQGYFLYLQKQYPKLINKPFEKFHINKGPLAGTAQDPILRLYKPHIYNSLLTIPFKNSKKPSRRSGLLSAYSTVASK